MKKSRLLGVACAGLAILSFNTSAAIVSWSLDNGVFTELTGSTAVDSNYRYSIDYGSEPDYIQTPGSSYSWTAYSDNTISDGTNTFQFTGAGDIVSISAGDEEHAVFFTSTGGVWSLENQAGTGVFTDASSLGVTAYDLAVGSTGFGSLTNSIWVAYDDGRIVGGSGEEYQFTGAGNVVSIAADDNNSAILFTDNDEQWALNLLNENDIINITHLNASAVDYGAFNDPNGSFGNGWGFYGWVAYADGTIQKDSNTSFQFSGPGTIVGIEGIDGDSALIYVSTVPLPGAVWLFGSGLLGLVGIARRKKVA